MLLEDLRLALRQLRKTPGFALTAVATLAFGIGSTTAIFSIVEGVLLRPLPFAAGERLVLAGDIPEGVDEPGDQPGVTAPGVLTYARATRAFEGLGGFQQTTFELSGSGEPEQINAARLSAGVFGVLGIRPLLGRTFTRGEDEGRRQVAVIGYRMWVNRLHADPAVLGTTLLLDRRPYQVIGVMPRAFEFPMVPGQLGRSELWVPMSFAESELVQGAGSWNFRMVGRLKAGVTPEQARQDMVPAALAITRSLPPALGSLRVHPRVTPLAEATVRAARPLVHTLFLAVIVVLFIACANLAGLLLVRVINRRREIAVRLALGAPGGRIVRQSLAEALLLSLGGGLLGLGMAAAALRAGLGLLPESLPRVSAIGLDREVIAFALLLALLTGLVSGLAPAIAATRTGVSDALREGGRTGSEGGGQTRLRSALVVAEIAVALILLAASGLLVRSFERMRAVDLGFRSDHTLTAGYGLPRQQYSTQASVDAFDRALLERLRQLPGVRAAGLATQLPASGDQSSNAFVAEGYVPPPGAGLSLAWPSVILGDYLEAQGVPLLRGRLFTAADTATAPPVVIVNRALAEHYWPGQDPVGRRLHIGVRESPVPWMTVVGEIGDIRQSAADMPVRSQLYTPAAQLKAVLGQFAPPDMLAGDGGAIVIRTGRAPEEMAGPLRAAVRALDPQLPLVSVRSMDEVVRGPEAARRFNAVLVSAFAAAAVLLAALGIYSVIAFSAAARRQELAIRLALGSGRRSVLRLVLVSGARLGILGCLIGGAGEILAAGLLRAQLFEVSPLDPPVLVLAAASILLLTLAASVIPAARAARIEPMQALRAQ